MWKLYRYYMPISSSNVFSIRTRQLFFSYFFSISTLSFNRIHYYISLNICVFFFLFLFRLADSHGWNWNSFGVAVTNTSHTTNICVSIVFVSFALNCKHSYTSTHNTIWNYKCFFEHIVSNTFLVMCVCSLAQVSYNIQWRVMLRVRRNEKKSLAYFFTLFLVWNMAMAVDFVIVFNLSFHL